MQPPEYANGRYSWSELVFDARTAGMRASRDLIRDWVQLGLIGAPDPGRGLGRGAGRAVGTWSGAQRELFLDVLRRRQRPHGASVPELTNVPVWHWLTAPEEFVTLEQVRRALVTWATAPRRHSEEATLAEANAAVREISHPDAPRRDRERLRMAYAELIQGGPFEPIRLVDRLRSIVGGDGAIDDGPPSGLTPGLQVARLWALNVTADDLAMITDDQFVSARDRFVDHFHAGFGDPSLPSASCRLLVLIARLLSVADGIEVWTGRRVSRQ
jgi:hypothetical protein